ncbi:MULTISPECIES: energy transducer TonB [Acinetobacter]|jgi:hypothetical protein|uniref:hypothetical protein n=1 Tax=Acinetobacter TaxID=469 RepID=UPI000B3CBDDA|nr:MULTISPECIES: hypothetical protein [Acinetobacter]AXY60395.1 hypothetical protein CDG61_10370 [Acinetobacter sp. WCHAc010052]WOE40305.1 hypothetical protein QSG87_10345 [Acinetobacter chinensis]
MKNKIVSASFMTLVCTAAQASPHEYNKLLKSIKTKQPEYSLKKQDYTVDPMLLNREYYVGWVVRPAYNLTPAEMSQAISPVRVRMTVIAAKGIIAETEIIKGSGQPKIDEKIKRALLLAKLEPIPRADRYLTYPLVYDLDIRNAE